MSYRRPQALATIVLLPVILVAVASAQEAGSFVSGMQNQSGLAFSPDGETAYWTAWNGSWGKAATSQYAIYTSRWLQGVWSAPEVAKFSGEFNDSDPFVAPDGDWIYFVSDRPAPDGVDGGQGDIWRASLYTGDVEWVAVNSPAAEYSPVMTSTGALYFASARVGGPGQGDIYRAVATSEGFGVPEPLGPHINSATGEWNLWVADDESEMLFEASSRSTNVSEPGDLYYSRRTPEGWTASEPVTLLNSSDSDLLPRFHPNGRTLFYTTAPIGSHARITSVDWPSIRQGLIAVAENALKVAPRSQE